jgi:hypothetical protein
MADIKLNDLQPAGVDFFEDNEGYLNEGYLSELSEDELTVWGGSRSLIEVNAEIEVVLTIPQ